MLEREQKDNKIIGNQEEKTIIIYNEDEKDKDKDISYITYRYPQKYSSGAP